MVRPQSKKHLATGEDKHVLVHTGKHKIGPQNRTNEFHGFYDIVQSGKILSINWQRWSLVRIISCAHRHSRLTSDSP
jgi:hypothetical protein